MEWLEEIRTGYKRYIERKNDVTKELEYLVNEINNADRELNAKVYITDDFDLSWNVKIGNMVVNFKHAEILRYQLRYSDDSGSELLQKRGDLRESLKSMILYEFNWPVSD